MCYFIRVKTKSLNNMFSEKFPKIDPLVSGHSAADKILEKQKQQELEAEVDRVAAIDQELKEQEKREKEELYAKDPEEEWFKK
jgi:hypothetical protein